MVRNVLKAVVKTEMHPFSRKSGWVCKANRIIPTIGKHVIAQQTLAGGGEDVGIDKAADLGVVISRLQIVEPGFRIEVIAAVAEGVHVSKRAGLAQNIAPGIVRIACDASVAGIIDCQHVALKILSEVILPPGGVPGIPQTDAVHRSALIEDIADVDFLRTGGCVPGFANRSAVDDLINDVASVGANLLGSDAVLVVLIIVSSVTTEGIFSLFCGFRRGSACQKTLL